MPHIVLENINDTEAYGAISQHLMHTLNLYCKDEKENVK